MGNYHDGRASQMVRRALLFWGGIFICILTHAQTSALESFIKSIRENNTLSVQMRSDIMDSVYQVAVSRQDTCLQIEARIAQSGYLDAMGLPDSSLLLLYWANHFDLDRCSKETRFDLLLSFSSLFLTFRDLKACDSICELALAQEDPAWKSSKQYFGILNNYFISQYTRGDTQLQYTLHRTYADAVLANNKEAMLSSLSNLGAIKGIQGDLDSSIYYLRKTVALAKQDSNTNVLIDAMINLANAEAELGHFRQAFAFLDTAQTMALSYNDYSAYVGTLFSYAEAYAQAGRFETAYDSLRVYVFAFDSLINEQRIQAVAEVRQKYEAEKSARQIQQLELDKLDAQLEKERIVRGRNALIFGVVLVFVVALALLNRLLFVRRSRSEVQHQRDISDQLLLNILPATVAEELKEKGYADARNFPNATILFSDFQSFTVLSEQMSATELVEELNICFRKFDEIMTRYQIEKIKTIGDAYMAAAGIPDTNQASTAEVVRAALEMQHFVRQRWIERQAAGLNAFRMRVGIHTGPVIAGIVGVKKFQYDLWGDTVNTASRMQTSGEVDKVNISEQTYQAIRHHPDFVCIPRGIVDVKGKGEMNLYFVEETHPRTN